MSVKSKFESQAVKSGFSVDFEMGFWLSVLLFLATAALTVYALAEGHKASAPQPAG